MSDRIFDETVLASAVCTTTQSPLTLTTSSKQASYAAAQQPSRRKPAWPFATAARADDTPPHTWLAEVHRARSVASPDAPAAMATILGAAAALQGLRGSLLDGGLAAWGVVDDARNALKAKLRWVVLGNGGITSHAHHSLSPCGSTSSVHIAAACP